MIIVNLPRLVVLVERDRTAYASVGYESDYYNKIVVFSLFGLAFVIEWIRPSVKTTAPKVHKAWAWHRGVVMRPPRKLGAK